MPIIQIYVDDRTHTLFVTDPEKEVFKAKIKDFIVDRYKEFNGVDYDCN